MSTHRPRASTGHAVRKLLELGEVSACQAAGTMYRERVDSFRLARATRFSNHLVLQTDSAQRRGIEFERHLRKQDYLHLREVLAQALGLEADQISFVRGPEREHSSEEERWEHTRRSVQEALVQHRPQVPVTVLDSAVVRSVSATRGVGYVEVDNLVIDARSATLRVAETKSWPTIDGSPADPGACGKALDQAAIYVHLLRTELDQVRTDDRVWLVTPLNVGFTPTLTEHPVTGRLRRVAELALLADEVFLSRPEDPAAWDLGERLRRAAPVTKAPEHVAHAERAIEDLLSSNATAYEPSMCARSCGLSLACRERSLAAGQVALLGPSAIEAVSGVENLHRVLALAQGGTPNPGELAAARQLQRAQSLIEEAAPR